jgi:hypothetical protein
MKIQLSICATVLSVLSLATSAAAQPAPAPAVAAPDAPAATAPPAAAPEATPAAEPVMTTQAAPVAAPATAAEMAQVGAGPTPPELKQSCMAAINSDQQWTDELATTIEKRVRFKVHNEEAELIALNKRHVVLAYGVLWLIAVGFLFAQWRRQQALKRQIAHLQSDLEAAIKGPTA